MLKYFVIRYKSDAFNGGKKMKNMKKRNKSLASRILWLLIGVVVLAQTLVGAGVYWRVSELIKSQRIQAAEDLSDQIAISIDNYLAGYEGIVRALGQQGELRQIMSDETAEQELLATFEGFVNQNPGIFYLYMGTEDGRMLMKPDDDLGPGYDPRVRDWYLAAKEAGSFIWTDPYFDDTVDQMMISACQPVYDPAGRFVGVVAADLTLDTLNAQTRDFRIGERGFPMVVDRMGTIMTHPDATLIGKGLSIPELEEALASGNEAGVDFAEEEEDGTLEKKYGAISRIESLNWIVVSSLYYEEINRDLMRVLMLIFLVSLATIALSVFLVQVFTRRFKRQIDRLVETMRQARTGDLDVRSAIDSDDEIGTLSRYFDETIAELGKLVGEIKRVATSLADASENLAATSEEVSASADEVAHSVDEIARGAQDQAGDAEHGARIADSLSQRFMTLGQTTGEMLTITEETDYAYQEGIGSVENLAEKNKEAMAANADIERAILQLNERTEAIGGILDAIASISEQTNLLALNASIEAARAGEHGRGFAVVAEEIRKLAEESAESADRVRVIVGHIRSDGSASVSSMGTLKRLAEQQDTAVHDVVVAFGSIRRAYEQIADKIMLIGAAVQEVDEDRERFVVSIGNISAVSEETAAASQEVSASMDQQTHAVEEVAKAAQDLNQIGLELSSAIDRFKV